MLREAIVSRTELGQQADQIMKKGELVPDELVISLIQQKLGSDECLKGVLFDGFPRTLDQAWMLDSLLENQGVTIDRVLEF